MLNGCLVIGATILDIRMDVDKLPQKGDDIAAHSLSFSLGGCAYNVANIMNHFQVPHRLFAPIGTGFFADKIKEQLCQEYQENLVQYSEQDNGFCLCLIEADGERTFITLPGVECNFQEQWFEKINMDNFNSIYVCGYEIEGDKDKTILNFLEKYPDHTLYYAPGPRICHIEKQIQKQIFSLHPVLHLNKQEALTYTGQNTIEKSAEYLYGETQNDVIITLGSEGTYYYNGRTDQIIPSISVKPIDTNGAGDSHIGSIIAGRLEGLSMEKSIERANKVASVIVKTKGSTLTKDDFEKAHLK